MKYTIPTLMALSQETGVVCNWTQSAKECRLIRPSPGTTPALKENPQNALAENSAKPSTPVKDFPLKAKTRRGRRAKRPPNAAPATTFAPSEAGFVQFLKEHSSPKHQRVTAGGRIVPMPFIEDDPVEEPSGRQATTQDRRMAERNVRARPEHWILARAFSPTTTEAPRGGLLPGFDPARDGHANVDPFVRSLQPTDRLAEMAINRLREFFNGRTDESNLARASGALQNVMGVQPDTPTMSANQQYETRAPQMAQASPGLQNALAMHPPVQTFPVAQQYVMHFPPSLYPPAQIAPVVPQYAMGVGHMAQGYASPRNTMVMHPVAQIMPVTHRPDMGFSPAAQMTPVPRQNDIGVRSIPPTSATMQDTMGVHHVAESTFEQSGARLNPTAPEFVHGATMQDTMPPHNSAPAQPGVPARATLEDTQPVRDAAPAQPNVQPSWPPVTPPSRPLEVQTSPVFDSSVISPEGRDLNAIDLSDFCTVVTEVVSLIPLDTAMPITEYERRLVFLINLIFTTRESEGLLGYLLRELRHQESRLTQRLDAVNMDIALFELHSQRQRQLQARPDFVGLRVYWSLAKDMTVRAIAHLERILSERMERWPERMAEEDEGRADFEAVENALARSNLPFDPEMTIEDGRFDLFNLSDDVEENDESEQTLIQPHSNMEHRQEMNRGPHVSRDNEANEASRPSTSAPSQDSQASHADVTLQGMGENAGQIDAASDAPATEGDNSALPLATGPSWSRSTEERSVSRATRMNMDLDAEYDADVDMPQHGGHSQVLARQLANRRRARASVPRASPTTVVSLVHAFDEFSLDGSNRPNN